MNNFEFVRYEPTLNEKHLGIATVKAWGKIALRYKVIQKKDGLDIFPAPASYKISETYVPCFTIDSNSDKDEIEHLIKSNVRALTSRDAQPAARPQIYTQNTQTELPF